MLYEAASLSQRQRVGRESRNVLLPLQSIFDMAFVSPIVEEDAPFDAYAILYQ